MAGGEQGTEEECDQAELHGVPRISRVLGDLQQFCNLQPSLLTVVMTASRAWLWLGEAGTGCPLPLVVYTTHYTTQQPARWQQVAGQGPGKVVITTSPGTRGSRGTGEVLLTCIASCNLSSQNKLDIQTRGPDSLLRN